MNATDAAGRAREQYAGETRNLDRRVAIHRYGRNPEPWPVFVRRHLPDRPGDRVLDVGAGTGVLWAQPLPTPSSWLVLTDRFSPMCQTLRGIADAVVQCSADDLPFQASTFDGVVCSHVLYHVPDPAQAVDEMLRVGTPNAWLAVATNGPSHLSRIGELARDAGVDVVPPAHLRFTIEDAAHLLSARGLRVDWHPYDDELTVPSADPVLDYLDSLGQPITDAAREHIRAAVERECQSTGGFRIAKDTALLIARRP